MTDLQTDLAVPDEATVDTFMRGGCHAHAVASVRLHGGHFAICYDDSEPYYESEDGDDDVSSVQHVWSVHETPSGLIARDVFGDVPLTKEALQERLALFFPDMAGAFAWGDARIDDQGTLGEVLDLSGDEDHQPLSPLDEEFLLYAMTLPSVRAAPGTAPALSADVIRELSGQNADPGSPAGP